MTSFSRMKTGEKIAFGCFVAPLVLVVGWVLWAVVYTAFGPEPRTAAQEACNRQGITCDADGYPVGLSDETKRRLERGD